MPHRLLALVECEILVWARTRASMTLEHAARVLDLPPERLDALERGEVKPSLEQLRVLAQVYGVTLGMFFLPEPPLEDGPLFRPLLTSERRRSGTQ